MDFVFTDRHRPRQRARRAQRRRATASTTSPAATETSLLELAETLLRVMGSDLHVEHGPSARSTASTRRLADTSAAARDLGFTAEVGLEEGLRALVDWWRPLRAEIADGADGGAHERRPH